MYSFSYAPQRKYPYKWLTPLVAAGSVVAIAIVLFINIQTQSYELVASPSNTTSESQVKSPGSNGLLKYLRRDSSVSCDYATLPLNSEVFTQNYVLPYTITRVWQQTADGTKVTQGVLSYREHALNDCNVTNVEIFVNGRYTQSAVVSARTRVGFVIKTSVVCAIEVDKMKNTKTYFKLQGTYNYLDDNPHFLLRNATSSPSLYWGQSLLELYYLVASHEYFDASLGESWGYPDDTYYAYINLKRLSKESVGNTSEVQSDDFFDVYCTTEHNVCRNNTIPLLTQSGELYPGIWRAVNLLGKAMWFTVMTDLGQKEINVPNMLADKYLLANLTSNMTNDVNAFIHLEESGVSRGSTIKFDTTLANRTFDPSAIPAPALGINTSYFSTTYICQKPVLKPLGTRFIAVLSSSLILLHTIWKVFWLVFNWVVLRKLHKEENNGVGVHNEEDTRSEELELKGGEKTKNYTQVHQTERLSD